MSGYQEIVTDPSYDGQIVCFTAPMVGNYGVEEARSQSTRVHATAVVMREARGPSGPTGCTSAGSSRLTGVDTRSLVLHLRERRCDAGRRRRGRRSTSTRSLQPSRAQPAMAGAALVAGVSPPERYTFTDEGDVRVAVVDYGCKRSILRRLAANGAAVDVFPHDVDADTLAGYDGVLLGNGPGDPAPLVDEIAAARASCSGARPCSASASGTSCSRLPPGTRRSSCRSAIAARTTRCSTIASRGVLVTSQNHGFAVAPRDGARRHSRLALRRHGRGPRLPGAARALVAVPSRGAARAARRPRRSSPAGSRSLKQAA